MNDAAFDSLVNQRLNLVLSSDRPLAVQHSALRLLRRLHDTPAVRVAADAPLDPTELIELVNRIVAGLSIREATDTATGVQRLAVLPVRVNAERTPDSIQLLVRLCRALPGSGLRLILIIEHPPALTASLAALGTTAFHWDIRPAAAAEELSSTPPGEAASQTQRDAPFAGAPAARESAPPRHAEAAAASAPAPPASIPLAAGPVPTPGMLARIIDSAANRPLHFALWVVGVPGLLIAGVLAIGSALQPARAPSSGAGAQPVASPPSAQQSTAAKSPSGTPKSLEATGGQASPVATPTNPAQTSVPSGTASAPAPARTAAARPGTALAPPPAAVLAAPSVTAPAAPSVTTPAGSSAAAPPSAPGTPPPSAQVTAPGAATTAVPAPGTAAASAFECTQATVPVPQAQPRNPSKDGGMVYLTSGRPVMVCVIDGTGALTQAEITPDQSRSFFGRAPWQVQASSLRDLQIFFQGARITLPRNATDRLELIEQRLN